MNCTHTKIDRVATIVDDIYGYGVSHEYSYEEVSTMEDIDLHRMKCTQCGKVDYYSSRARDFYENGIENETYGLTTFNLIKHGGYIKGR